MDYDGSSDGYLNWAHRCESLLVLLFFAYFYLFIIIIIIFIIFFYDFFPSKGVGKRVEILEMLEVVFFSFSSGGDNNNKRNA